MKRKRTDLTNEEGFWEWLASVGGVLIAMAQLLLLLGYAINEIVRTVRSISSGQAAAWQ